MNDSKMSERIEAEIVRYTLETGKPPQVIYMHPESISAFLYYEGQQLLRYQVAHPSGKCPHCGKSLLTYKGIPIEELPKGVVVGK